MEIKLNTGSVAPIVALRDLEKRGPVEASGDDAVFANTEAVRAMLNEIPDTRADVVARARSLVASINYPPPAALDSLAKLLAMHIQL